MDNLNEKIKLFSRRDDDEKISKFLELMDSLHGIVDYNIAVSLLGTFSDDDDFGTQESVISALTSVSDEIYLNALLDNISELFQRSPSWAETLILNEVSCNYHSFINRAQKNIAARDILVRILSKDDILKFEENAKKALEILENK